MTTASEAWAVRGSKNVQTIITKYGGAQQIHMKKTLIRNLIRRNARCVTHKQSPLEGHISLHQRMKDARHPHVREILKVDARVTRTETKKKVIRKTPSEKMSITNFKWQVQCQKENRSKKYTRVGVAVHKHPHRF